MFPITISKASQQSFMEVYNCDNKLIYNGIVQPLISEIDKTNKYKLNEKTKIFIHPGRISEAKNQIVLCSVFDRLIKEGYDVVLLIAGMREDELIYQKIKPYFNNRIIYLGERCDITDIMQFCDGFCLPSLWEGMPISLLAALATGCIPICSPVGGINDVIIDGFNGILSESPLELHYYESVRRFLEYSERDICLVKKRAKESFLAFNITTTAKKYFELYQSLISGT